MTDRNWPRNHREGKIKIIGKWGHPARCYASYTVSSDVQDTHMSHWSDKNENYFMNRRKKLKGVSDIFDRETERYTVGILSQWRSKFQTLWQRINKVVVTDSNAQTEEMWLDFRGYWKSPYSVNGRKSESEKLNATVCSEYLKVWDREELLIGERGEGVVCFIDRINWKTSVREMA